MTYQPLARKYRPNTFEDLVGQEAAVKALGGGIRLGREPHTVIFSGVRGIGKTTLARIYAKALNCENGPTPTPCGTCESCEAIAIGTHEDVLEIDGASNTSVEDVRSLRETISYAPQRSGFKVYIIDEVHMLSNSAFNALLKTLEEPPSHVVFLFATTELAKIPQTIIGRCQTFYLNKFTHSDIYRRLATILEKENIPFEGAALNQVAKQGKGSMRDALTFLDTAIAISNSNLTIAGLEGLLDGIDTSTGINLIQLLINRDSKKVIDELEALDSRGVEWKELIEELAIICRHAFIVKELGEKAIDAQLLGLAPHDLEQLAKLAESSQPIDLNRLFRALYQAGKDLSGTHIDRYLVENNLLEWCLDPGIPTIDDWQKALKGAPVQNTLTGASTHAPSRAPAATISPAKPPQQPPEPEQKREPASGISLKDRLSGAKAKDPSQVAAPVAPPAAVEVAAPVAPPAAVEVAAPVAPPAAVEVAAPVAPLAAVEVAAPVAPPAAVEAAAPVAPPAAVEAPSISIQGAESAAPSGSNEFAFPQSWRQMVDLWQERKPLQARIFEESFATEFGPAAIIIAVDEKTMAGRKLLNPEIQQKTLAQIRQMFGFEGTLSVITKEQAVSGAKFVNMEPQAQEDESKTVLVEKKEEKAELIARTKQELIDDSSTRAALDIFGGRVADVIVTNP